MSSIPPSLTQNNDSSNNTSYIGNLNTNPNSSVINTSNNMHPSFSNMQRINNMYFSSKLSSMSFIGFKQNNYNNNYIPVLPNTISLKK